MIVATALIDMYCKLGSLKHARKLFDSVCVKDLVLWNTMIIGRATGSPSLFSPSPLCTAGRRSVVVQQQATAGSS